MCQFLGHPIIYYADQDLRSYFRTDQTIKAPYSGVHGSDLADYRTLPRYYGSISDLNPVSVNARLVTSLAMPAG